MSDYTLMVNRQRKWMFYLLALLVLGWGFTPYQDIFLGLILGSSISFYNLWLLQRKVEKVGRAGAQQKRVNLGTITRLSSAALAAVIALRYPQYFHMVAVVIGLMTSYFVIMIDYLLHHKEISPGK